MALLWHFDRREKWTTLASWRRPFMVLDLRAETLLVSYVRPASPVISLHLKAMVFFFIFLLSNRRSAEWMTL